MARRFERSSARRVDWGQGPTASDVGMSGNAKVLWTSNASTTVGQTVVRTRGQWHVYLTAATAIGDGYQGAMGLTMVSADAASAGAASVPGPYSDPIWNGWLWHSYFDVRVLSTTLADGVNAMVASQRGEIDSKAMRKFEPGQTFIGVVEGVESGTAVLEFQADTRVLLKAF